jgi:hypothetical protein
MTRPAFAKDFPPELDALVDAFAAGNFARVREGTAELLARSEDEAVRAAAKELRDRTKPDPLALWLLGLTALLLLFLTGWWIAHSKAPSGPAPAPPVTIERIKG